MKAKVYGNPRPTSNLGIHNRALVAYSAQESVIPAKAEAHIESVPVKEAVDAGSSGGCKLTGECRRSSTAN